MPSGVDTRLVFPLALILLAWVPFAAEEGAHVISRLKAYLDSLMAWNGHSAYALVSNFLAASAVIAMVVVFSSRPQNPIFVLFFWGHWLSVLALVLVVLRLGFGDILRGVYASVFLFVVHEVLWFGAFMVTDSAAVWTTFMVSAPYLLAFLGFLGAYRHWRLPPTKELGVLATVSVIIALWATAGMQVSQDLGVPSQYFLNPDVNLVEILSWVCPAVVLIL